MSLKERGKIVEEVFGPETNKPNVLGQALLDCNFSAKQMKHPSIKSLRLLPDRHKFRKETIYWKNTIFDEIPL